MPPLWTDCHQVEVRIERDNVLTQERITKSVVSFCSLLHHNSTLFILVILKQVKLRENFNFFFIMAQVNSDRVKDLCKVYAECSSTIAKIIFWAGDVFILFLQFGRKQRILTALECNEKTGCIDHCGQIFWCGIRRK